MTTLDERAAYLEGKVEEHSRGFGELRDAIRQVDGHLRAARVGLQSSPPI